MVLLILFIIGGVFSFEADTSYNGIPIIITHNRAYGLSIDTTYKVCKCFWMVKTGWHVTYYGVESEFYPIELGYVVKRRVIK